MKNILFILFCAAILKIWSAALDKYGARSRLNLDYIEAPEYVQKLPGCGNNYRAASLSTGQMDLLLQTGIIRTVVHLGPDSWRAKKHRTICASYGVDFLRIKLGATDAVDTLRQRLLKGQTLVHYTACNKANAQMITKALGK